MTKEALDRIKEAYYSGLKVQIWSSGHWENFDSRDYPMNPDPFSEHRQYRIVGSAYVDIAEKQIAELKAQIEKMKNCNNCAGYYTEQCLGCEDYCNWKLKEIKEND